MKMLAIDPGFDRCGWAILDSKIQTPPHAYGIILTEKSQTFYQRLSIICTQINRVVELHSPQELAIETLFFSKNQTTAMRVAETRGAIMAVCLQHYMQISEYNPVQVKQAVTGNGKADKKAVDKMVRMQLHISQSEKLIDDTLDALAIGLTHQVMRRTVK